MYHSENLHELDFDYLFTENVKITNKNILQNTIDYYKKECVKGNDYVDPLYIDIENIVCFTVDNVLSNSECENIIKFSETQEYKDITTYRKDYRGNQRLILYSPKSADKIYARVKYLFPELNINGKKYKPYNLNPYIRFGKYNANDAFGAHKDSGLIYDENSYTLLTIMIYLNSVTDKLGNKTGKTRMLTLNKTPYKSEDLNCKILDEAIPSPGRCVIFSQNSIYHDGENVGNCVTPKYIMRTDVIYKL